MSVARIIRYAVAATVFWVSLSQVQPVALAQGGWAEQTELTGLIEARAGIGFHDGDDQLSELIVTPELKVDVSDDWRLTAIGRIRNDGSNRLEPDKPNQGNRDPMSRRIFLGEALDVELREFYLDGEIGDVFLRLGKQQVVWGQADGLKVLDIVNPQSFREFVLPDFDDSRIPLWTVKAEVPVSDAVTLEFVWVPDPTYHDIPDVGAAYAFTSPRLVPTPTPGVPVTVLPADRPNRFVADSDGGARLTAFLGGWEASLNYFYHYTDAPVLRRVIGPMGITASSGYERTHMIGGTFNNAFGNFVVRGEVGYSTDKFYLTRDVTDADGIAQSGELSFVIGVDWTGLSNTFISGQFFETIILSDAPGVVQDRVDNFVTFYAQRTFRNEIFTANALVIQSLNDGDGVIEGELTYELRDNVELFAGADIFYGKSRGLFGEFDDNDRVVAGARIGF